ncbi:MAG: hypothetical protein PF637_10975 [Spirochaetes bacterium]|jgi:hypothetical protein|nr:hypothetical protein [Spirochaetota bacterium]
MRPLGKIEEALSELGLKLSYAYEDLVFIETNTFLVRFDDSDDNHVYIHFNRDCSQKDEICNLIEAAFKNHSLRITREKDYELRDNPYKAEFDLVFQE